LVGFIALVVALMVCGARVQAQQPKMVHRIGYLSSGDATTESTRSEGIRLALRELGYIEGQNIAIEYRYSEAKVDRARAHAVELVGLKVDIIVVASGDPWIRAAKDATKTIPSSWWALDPILLGRALLKALLVPASTSPA
jgi:putative tryptophan/tyrosine transport system substrate-binding protein